MLKSAFPKASTGRLIYTSVRSHSSAGLPKATEIKSQHLPELPPSQPLKRTRYLQTAFPSLESISPQVLSTHTSEGAQKQAASWYFINRSRSNQLPVYLDWKVSGQVFTIIRKIDGNVSQLRLDLLKEFGINKKDITIKDASKKVAIRGNYSSQVKELLSKYF